MSMFGSLALDTDTPRVMKLADPFTGLPLVSKTGKNATISLYSQDSKVAAAFERQIIDARALNPRLRQTAESMERDMFQRIAHLTAGWELCDLEGEDLEVPFSLTNAVELYRQLPWAYEQALDFTRSRVNYKKD